MKEEKTGAQSVDEYILAFPEPVAQKLRLLREAIHQAAPGAEEKISYRMPAFVLNGILVYFAAYQKHIGFYPTPGGIAAFRQELSGYRSSKGAVQFPIDQPLPLELIQKIVRYRVSENLNR